MTAGTYAETVAAGSPRQPLIEIGVSLHRTALGRTQCAENGCMDSSYDLERFVAAQDRGGAFGRAIAELRRGRKVSHWMWFVFPQIAGLGRSAMARAFAISSIGEARAYLAHPVLGPRLLECARIVASIQAQTAEQIFGGVDAQKLHSSMTLFVRADPDQPVFEGVLDRFFAGVADAATDQLLSGE